MNFDKHGVVEMTPLEFGADRAKATNPIKIQDCSLRDGHQSLFATRGRTEDMIPIAEMMDEVGFHAIEAWGGATFDTMHRYLGEDPWERLRTLKKYITKTPIWMLLRGQKVVGYHSYPDDVVKAFVQRSIDNGVDIFRCGDSFNDLRNFETAAQVIKDNGKHFQGVLVYSIDQLRMGGDLYNMEYFINKTKELVDFGVDSICIKDMAGILAPYDAYNLISEMKKVTDVPLNLHSHFTTGMGDLTLFKAIEAGIEMIDTCMGPYAYRNSHPACEPIITSLLGTNRDSGLDINKIKAITDQMEKLIPKYKHLVSNTNYAIADMDNLLYQAPEWMLASFVKQLSEKDAIDKLPEVYRLMPKVRKDLGNAPLVTPTASIVANQTINNVLYDSYEGEYARITSEVKDLCYGLYGKTPAPINPELQKKALVGYPLGEEPTTERPGAIIAPGMDTLHEDIKDLAKDLDDEVLCAMYPDTGIRFLKWKYGKEEIPADILPKTMEQVEKEEEIIRKALAGELNNQTGKKELEVKVDGETFTVEISDPNNPSASPRVRRNRSINKEVIPTDDIKAPLPGMVVEFKKAVGDTVKVGDTVVVLEAMKMMNNLEATKEGVIKEINFAPGCNVAKDDVLVVIE